MNSLKNFSRLAVLGAKQMQNANRLMSADAREISLNKFKAKQVKFQEKNGLPVHLKGGASDKILYQITMGLCVVGTAWVMHLIYELSFPPKQD